MQDIGIGASEADRAVRLNEVSQADAFTRKHGGIRQGVAIPKQLVEMMGWSIGVQSVIGSGLRFGFTVHFNRQREHVSDSGQDADLGDRVAA